MLFAEGFSFQVSGEACVVEVRVTVSTVAKRVKLGSYYYVRLKVFFFLVRSVQSTNHVLRSIILYLAIIMSESSSLSFMDNSTYFATHIPDKNSVFVNGSIF